MTSPAPSVSPSAELSTASNTSPDLHSPPLIDERFSLAPVGRITTGAALAYGIGTVLGLTQGARTSGLRFRAENSHRLPTNQRGWYLYHQTKNAYVAKCAMLEGNRMGLRLVPWVVMFFGIEETMDTLRLKEDGGDDRKDFLSTTVAGVTVAGAFSAFNRFSLVVAARTAKLGLGVGLGFGMLQDALRLVKGQRLAYVDLIGSVWAFKISQQKCYGGYMRAEAQHWALIMIRRSHSDSTSQEPVSDSSDQDKTSQKDRETADELRDSVGQAINQKRPSAIRSRFNAA